MKNFFNTLCAFVISLLILLFFYQFISIPIIPAISIYIYLYLLNKFKVDNKILLILFLFLLTLISIVVYSIIIYSCIINYPEYKNFIGIIFDILTTFSFIGAFIISISALKENNKKF